MEITKDVFSLAAAIVGVAALALLIGNASKTATVVQATTGGFNALLKTITLSNSMGVGNTAF